MREWLQLLDFDKLSNLKYRVYTLSERMNERQMICFLSVFVVTIYYICLSLFNSHEPYQQGFCLSLIDKCISMLCNYQLIPVPVSTCIRNAKVVRVLLISSLKPVSYTHLTLPTILLV